MQSTMVLKQEKGPIPQWLTPLLTTSFFVLCNTHQTHKNECNMYCLDCTGDALCCHCRSEHNGHRLVRIWRLSYHNVVVASEISKFLDISGVQTYANNHTKAVFLNERPTPRPGKGAAQNFCEICHRGLIVSVRFCSLACKLKSMKHGDSELALSQGLKFHQGPILPTGSQSESSKRQKSSELSMLNCSDPTTPAIIKGPVVNNPIRRRKRKGIPHRAPFF